MLLSVTSVTNIVKGIGISSFTRVTDVKFHLSLSVTKPILSIGMSGFHSVTVLKQFVGKYKLLDICSIVKPSKLIGSKLKSNNLNAK